MRSKTSFPEIKEAVFNRLMKVNAVIDISVSIGISSSSRVMIGLLERRDNLKKLIQEILRFERIVNS